MGLGHILYRGARKAVERQRLQEQAQHADGESDGSGIPVPPPALRTPLSASGAPLHRDRHLSDNPDTMPRQLTVQEAARELGVSTRTVERRIRAGELLSVVVGGRRLVVAHPGWDSDTPTDTDRQRVSESDSPVGVTDNSDRTDRQTDNPDTDNSDTVSVLREQLARADERMDRLMGMLEEHTRTIRDLNQTNQGLMVRVAQLEGRVLPAEAPVHAPTQAGNREPGSRVRWSLKTLYRALRRR